MADSRRCRHLIEPICLMADSHLTFNLVSVQTISAAQAKTLEVRTCASTGCPASGELSFIQFSFFVCHKKEIRVCRRAAAEFHKIVSARSSRKKEM